MDSSFDDDDSPPSPNYFLIRERYTDYQRKNKNGKKRRKCRNEKSDEEQAKKVRIEPSLSSFCYSVPAADLPALNKNANGLSDIQNTFLYGLENGEGDSIGSKFQMPNDYFENLSESHLTFDTFGSIIADAVICTYETNRVPLNLPYIEEFGPAVEMTCSPVSQPVFHVFESIGLNPEKEREAKKVKATSKAEPKSVKEKQNLLKTRKKFSKRGNNTNSLPKKNNSTLKSIQSVKSKTTRDQCSKSSKIAKGKNRNLPSTSIGKEDNKQNRSKSKIAKVDVSEAISGVSNLSIDGIVESKPHQQPLTETSIVNDISNESNNISTMSMTTSDVKLRCPLPPTPVSVTDHNDIHKKLLSTENVFAQWLVEVKALFKRFRFSKIRKNDMKTITLLLSVLKTELLQKEPCVLSTIRQLLQLWVEVLIEKENKILSSPMCLRKLKMSDLFKGNRRSGFEKAKEEVKQRYIGETRRLEDDKKHPNVVTVPYSEESSRCHNRASLHYPTRKVKNGEQDGSDKIEKTAYHGAKTEEGSQLPVTKQMIKDISGGSRAHGAIEDPLSRFRSLYYLLQVHVDGPNHTVVERLLASLRYISYNPEMLLEHIKFTELVLMLRNDSHPGVCKTANDMWHVICDCLHLDPNDEMPNNIIRIIIKKFNYESSKGSPIAEYGCDMPANSGCLEEF